MFQKQTTGWSRIVAFVLAAAILGGMGTAAFAAGDEEGEKSICRRALDNCLLDSIKSGAFAFSVTLLLAVSSCLAGYDFCQRYVRFFVEEFSR